MRPKLNLLSEELVKQIIQEGFALLMNPGIQVHNDEALSLLRLVRPHIVLSVYSSGLNAKSTKKQGKG